MIISQSKILLCCVKNNVKRHQESKLFEKLMFCLVNCLFFLRNKIKRVQKTYLIITVIRTISTGYGILLQVEYILHHAIFFILFIFCFLFDITKTKHCSTIILSFNIFIISILGPYLFTFWHFGTPQTRLSSSGHLRIRTVAIPLQQSVVNNLWVYLLYS